MKSLLEITRSEWAATRDALLDVFVLNTAETYYSKGFIDSVFKITNGFMGLKTGVNLNVLDKKHFSCQFQLIAEIRAIQRLIAVMPYLLGDFEMASDAFWDDDFDPDNYECHDEDWDDDPRLYPEGVPDGHDFDLWEMSN